MVGMVSGVDPQFPGELCFVTHHSVDEIDSFSVSRDSDACRGVVCGKLSFTSELREGAQIDRILHVGTSCDHSATFSEVSVLSTVVSHTDCICSRDETRDVRTSDLSGRVANDRAKADASLLEQIDDHDLYSSAQRL